MPADERCRRSGEPSLWRQPLADGTPDGSPSIVAGPLPGLLPIGQTEQGFAYGTGEGTRNTYQATVDFETGSILGDPKPVPRPRGR